jgi:hypothetical protein
MYAANSDNKQALRTKMTKRILIIDDDEERLQRGDALSEAEARRLSELTAALRLEVELGQPPEQGF